MHSVVGLREKVRIKVKVKKVQEPEMVVHTWNPNTWWGVSIRQEDCWESGASVGSIQ